MSEGTETIADTQEIDQAVQAALHEKAQQEGLKLVDKIKYLGVQMNTMDAKEKLKYTGQFEKLSKSLGRLRRMIRQKMPDNSWHLTVWLCVTLLVLIYG